MPFIRHTRDKRGYETTYVLHGYRPVPGPQRTRVLYLFRSPSHLKIGRHPLDDEIREALEHTHPDVSFDWSALSRESAMLQREDARDRDRDRDRDRERGPRGPRAQTASRGPAPTPIPVVIEDHSVLGRALGAERAARVRVQYAELLQRIARRSRTPEDRDRLNERLQRLNPDEWPDEATVRAQIDAAVVEWEAVAGELPARRRGRRGGRKRERDGAPNGGPGAEDPDTGDAESSGIMADGGERDDISEREEGDRPDRGAGPARVDGRVGPEYADQPAGDGLPDDD